MRLGIFLYRRAGCKQFLIARNEFFRENAADSCLGILHIRIFEVGHFSLRCFGEDLFMDSCNYSFGQQMVFHSASLETNSSGKKLQIHVFDYKIVIFLMLAVLL